MKKGTPRTTQYTIRRVPDDVDRALRAKAKQRNCSLNRVLLDELTRAAVGAPKKSDFQQFVGIWEPDPAFDEILASQRRIDWEKWR